MRLELNEKCQCHWEDLGEGTEVLVIDDVLKNAEQVREYALGLRWEAPPVKDKYPGVKAHSTLRGAAALADMIVKHFLQRRWRDRCPGVLKPAAARVSGQVFAAMTLDRQRAQRVAVDQHVDNFAWLATVLYLFRTDDVELPRGTAFWSHRVTGLQHWLQADQTEVAIAEQFFGLSLRARLGAIVAQQPCLQQDLIARALFDRRESSRRCFSLEDDPQWRLIRVVGARFNRLIAYPTFQVHSPVECTDPSSLTRDNVRLTLNSFISYPIATDGQLSTAYERSCYLAIDGLESS